MPRIVSPTLRPMYERMNPNVCEFVEIAQPDVGQVLRRWTDQLSVNPPRLSDSPGGKTQQSPGGGMMLLATPGTVATFNTVTGNRIALTVPDQSKILRGVGWTIDQSLKPMRVKRITLTLSTINLTTSFAELQIYRMRGVPGRFIDPNNNATQTSRLAPEPLLAKPARVALDASFPGGINTTHDVAFDLTPYALDIEHRNVPAPTLTQTGELPELLIVCWLTDAASNGHYRWEVDTTHIGAARTVSGIGVFQDVTWERRLPNGTLSSDPNDPRANWVAARQDQVPSIKVEIDTYPATSQEVYAITLPRAPVAASVGRVVFIREDPLPVGDGGSTLELSTAGSGGPFVAVSHGDLVTTKQATYHLRATLNASGDTHRSPVIEGLGLEFRIPVDVSAEVTVDPIPQDVNVPFLDAAIGEGKATIVRTGVRDYRDPASDLMAGSAATQLQVDHYLGSRHPAITRAQWYQMGRAIVTARQATPTSEILSTISYLKVTKKQIPQRTEVVNVVLAAQSATTANAIQVGSGVTLPNTSVGGEYNGLNYFIRLVSTSVAGLAPGMIFPVAGNTGTHQIDLVVPTGATSAMPAALAVNDTFELHSASYSQPKLSWTNADPSDVWYEILTVWLAVPKENIGLSALGIAGRSGLPPKLADRAPGDTATQDKLRVSRTITDQTEAKALLDQLSFIMQGVTTEIAGQIVFVAFYDLLDPSGNLVLPPREIAATFDLRDYSQLETPQGVESRVTSCSCTYGVDSSLGSDAAAPSTVVFADADAVAWYTQQDLEEIGNSAIPDDIAAWCFNAADGGLYLASTLCRQVVRALSTGLRLWPWTAIDQYPDLCVGDRVIVMTDEYVDYDPTTGVQIRGLWAFPLVLTHVARNGREFRGVMLGLSTAVPVRGGSGTSSVGLVGQPSIGNISFDAAGNLIVTVNQGTPPGGGFRIAASGSGVPSDATVDAGTFTSGLSATVNLGGGWTAGAQLQVKVIAYASSDTAGARSLASTGHATVPGGSSSNTFTSITQSSPDYTLNTVQINWAWSGATATFNVWVSELGSVFVEIATGVSGSPVTYNANEDLRASGGNTNDHIIAYVEAVIGGVVVATSIHRDVTYRAQV